MTDLPTSTAGATLAKVSVVCGLLGPFTLGAGTLLGLLLGGLAVVRCRKLGGTKKTEKMAVAGIITSVICMPLSVLAFFTALSRLHN